MWRQANLRRLSRTKAKTSLESRTKGAKLCKSQLVSYWAPQALSQDVIDALKPKLSKIAAKNKLNPLADGIERKAPELFEALLGKTDIKTSLVSRTMVGAKLCKSQLVYNWASQALSHDVIDALKPKLSTIADKNKLNPLADGIDRKAPELFEALLGKRGSNTAVNVPNNRIFGMATTTPISYPELADQLSDIGRLMGMESAAGTSPVLQKLFTFCTTLMTQLLLQQSTINQQQQTILQQLQLQQRVHGDHKADNTAVNVPNNRIVGMAQPSASVQHKTVEKTSLEPETYCWATQALSNDVIDALKPKLSTIGAKNKLRTTTTPAPPPELADQLSDNTKPSSDSVQHKPVEKTVKDISQSLKDTPITPTPDVAIVLKRLDKVLVAPDKLMLLFLRHSIDEFSRVVTGLFVQYQRSDCLKPRSTIAPVERVSLAPEAGATPAANSAWQRVRLHVPCGDILTIGQCQTHSALSRFPFLLDDDGKSLQLNPPAEDIERKARELREALLVKADNTAVKVPNNRIVRMAQPSASVQHKPVAKTSLEPETYYWATQALSNAVIDALKPKLSTIGAKNKSRTTTTPVPPPELADQLSDNTKPSSDSVQHKPVEKTVKDISQSLISFKTKQKTDLPKLRQTSLETRTKGAKLYESRLISYWAPQALSQDVIDALKPKLSKNRTTTTPVPPPDVNVPNNRIVGMAQPSDPVQHKPLAKTVENISQSLKDTPITPTPDVAIVLKRLDKVLVAPDKLLLLFRRHSMDEFSRVVTGLFVQYQRSDCLKPRSTLAPVERVSLAPEAVATPAANSAWQRVRLHVPCGDILTIGQCQAHSALNRFPFLLDDDGKSLLLNPPAEDIERKARELREALLAKAYNTAVNVPNNRIVGMAQPSDFVQHKPVKKTSTITQQQRAIIQQRVYGDHKADNTAVKVPNNRIVRMAQPSDFVQHKSVEKTVKDISQSLKDPTITPTPDVAIVLKRLDKVLVAPDKLMLLFRRHSMDEFSRVVTGLFVQYQRSDSLKPRSTIAPVERVSLAPEAGATPAANSAWQRVRLHVPCGDILTIGQCQTHSALNRFPFLLDDDGKSLPLNPPAEDIERKARELREALLVKADNTAVNVPNNRIVRMAQPSDSVQHKIVAKTNPLAADVEQKAHELREDLPAKADNTAVNVPNRTGPVGMLKALTRVVIDAFKPKLSKIEANNKLNPPAGDIERKSRELREDLSAKADNTVNVPNNKIVRMAQPSDSDQHKTDTTKTPTPDVAIVLKRLDKVLVAPDKLLLLFRRHSMDEFSRVVTGLFVQYQRSDCSNPRSTIAPVERVSLAPEAVATPAANSAWKRVRLHVPCGDILTIGQCQTHSALNRFPFLLDFDGKSVPLNPPAEDIKRKARELREALLASGQ